MSTPCKGIRRRWTPEEEAELIQMIDIDGQAFQAADRRFNRVKGSSSAKYKELKAGIVRIPPGEREPKSPKPKIARTAQPWSAENMAHASSRWRELYVNIHGEDPTRSLQYPVFRIIGQEIGRSPSAIESRLRTHGPTFSVAPSCGTTAKPGAPPRDVILKAAERDGARLRQSPCSLLLGEPPPGFSALDDYRRRQACTGAPPHNNR